MSEEYSVEKIARFAVPVADVWRALTDPDMTQKFFFGCRVNSDWQVGSPLSYTMKMGEQEMSMVEGVITAVEPNVLLEHTCYAAAHRDNPDEHNSVTYKFAATDEGTELSIRQGPFKDGGMRAQHEASWDTCLASMKKELEG